MTELRPTDIIAEVHRNQSALALVYPADLKKHDFRPVLIIAARGGQSERILSAYCCLPHDAEDILFAKDCPLPSDPGMHVWFGDILECENRDCYEWDEFDFWRGNWRRATASDLALFNMIDGGAQP